MKKIKLDSLIKPKFFWGTIVVFLLITSTTFYIFKEEEKALRIYTQKQLAKTVDEKEVVEEELFIEKEKSSTLAEELEEKKHQIKLTLDKLENEIIARREAETRLVIAMKEKTALEEKINSFLKISRTIELEKIVIKPTSMLAGKVLEANKEYAFIILDLGRRNNLKLGDVLSVYRDGKFIGKAQVEKMDEKASAATILPEWQDVEFRINDEVKEI